ncbi:hypothetical protein [Pontibacter flavimaris]|uniref:hypothetical protein n=1 Tax=Pontibacter flavimaris TaxID=1797110 RepID=UPI001115400A|nr:hypothetical protein [Pontibacter flavimaris]
MAILLYLAILPFPLFRTSLSETNSAADFQVRVSHTFILAGLYLLLYFILTWRKPKVPEHFGASACAFLYFGHTFLATASFHLTQAILTSCR